MKQLLSFLAIFSVAYILNPKSLAAHIPVESYVGMQFGFFYLAKE